MEINVRVTNEHYVIEISKADDYREIVRALYSLRQEMAVDRYAERVVRDRAYLVTMRRERWARRGKWALDKWQCLVRWARKVVKRLRRSDD